MLSTLFGSLAAKITAVFFTAAAATGGLAAAGALPAPAQSVVAQAVSTVGLTLPASTRASIHEAGEVRVGLDGVTPTVAPSEKPEDRPTSTVAGGKDDKPIVPVADQRDHPTSTVHDDKDADDPNDHDDDDVAPGSAVANHGHCVEFADHIAGTLGLSDDQKDVFESLVAKDKTAVTVEVAAGGKPDAACQAAINKAKSAAAATPVTETETEGPNDDHHEGSGPDPKHSPGIVHAANVTTTSARESGGRGRK